MLEVCGAAPPSSSSTEDRVNARLRRVIERHFDPQGGAKYWLDRARALDFDPRREIRSLADLDRIGSMRPADLVGRPLRDFIPRSLHDRQSEWIIAQTGGATGNPAWTAYDQAEFHAAFVEPFLAAAKHVGFPRGATWLYAGPSGPHIIGRAAAQLSRALGGSDVLAVDFDPRWARKLPDGSFGQRRYVEHVVAQALEVLQSQPVEVIFTTPRLLSALAPNMSENQRAAIRGVHYGGAHLAADELHEFQQRWFPGAVHLSGYGNTLFGCCLELDVTSGRTPTYFPFGERLVFQPAPRRSDDGHRVPLCFTRLDETMLLIRVVERDEGEIVTPPADAPCGFVLPGVRGVGPRTDTPSPAGGLY